MSLRIIFAGTPEFAVPLLEALLQSQHQVVAVYTQPDRPAGRGQHLLASAVKICAQKAKVPIYQPTTLKSDDEQQKLMTFKADVMVVAAYGLLLPKAVLDLPRYGCINVHASLLPRWRGASPIQQAILAGDLQTGVTIMQMNEGLDTGDILHQTHCAIDPEDTAQTLHDRLAAIGPLALLETLEQVEKNSLKPIKQSNLDATYAPKIKKSDAKIDWKKSAIELARQVRAFNPWPVSYSEFNGKLLRIWNAIPLDEKTDQLPGSVVRFAKTGIDVSTGDGILRLLQIQFPSGKVLSAEEFYNGRGAYADYFRS